MILPPERRSAFQVLNHCPPVPICLAGATALFQSLLQLQWNSHPFSSLQSPQQHEDSHNKGDRAILLQITELNLIGRKQSRQIRRPRCVVVVGIGAMVFYLAKTSELVILGFDLPLLRMQDQALALHLLDELRHYLRYLLLLFGDGPLKVGALGPPVAARYDLVRRVGVRSGVGMDLEPQGAVLAGLL